MAGLKVKNFSLQMMGQHAATAVVGKNWTEF